MRIGIIGAGAVGCLFGAMLVRKGNDVLLLHRDLNKVKEIEEKGVRLRTPEGRSLSVRVSVRQGPTRLDGYNLILVAVKAYDTLEAACEYKNLLDSESTILTLQNGLGNLETLSRIFQPERVIAGSTSEAVYTTGLGAVVHTGRGTSRIGGAGGIALRRCKEIARTFREAGFRTVVSGNIEGVIWSKAIVNSAVNPITALTGLPNGKLLEEDSLRCLVSEVVQEGTVVGRAERVRLEPNPAVSVVKILASTRRNFSSMLQDILRRRRTEILQLNGNIVDRGARLGVPTPLNKALVALIAGVESSWTLPVGTPVPTRLPTH